ncbi:MAG: restriction endonuclease subunit S [Eubacterium sp.]
MAMKDSGIAWIGEIPEHWNIKKLKYLLKSNCVNMRVGPFGSALSGDDFKDEGYWVYNQRCVLDKNFETNDTFVDEYKYKELNAFTVDTGDMLITTRGTIGKVAIVPENCPIGILHPCIIKFVLNQDLINNELVELIFNNSNMIMDQIMRKSNATTIDVIYSYTLKDLLLPVIPMNEQKEIIDFLDKKCAKIDNILADLNKQVEILNAYKKSLITETVTKGLNPNVPTKDSGIDWIGKIPEHWTTMRVKNLALSNNSLFMDGDWIESDVIVESGIRYLTTGNVGNGFYKEQGSGYITEETFKKLNCLKVYPGDLMISRLNEPIGRACIVPNDEDYYVVAVDNVILRPDKKHNKKYLMYCMNTPGYAEAGKEAARGSTMQRVSRTILGTFFVPVAPLQEQELIADFLDKKCAEIDDLIADKTAQIEKMEKYKKSLIFEYVTGKKRVKEVV